MGTIGNGEGELLPRFFRTDLRLEGDMNWIAFNTMKTDHPDPSYSMSISQLVRTGCSILLGKSFDHFASLPLQVRALPGRSSI